MQSLGHLLFPCKMCQCSWHRMCLDWFNLDRWGICQAALCTTTHSHLLTRWCDVGYVGILKDSCVRENFGCYYGRQSRNWLFALLFVPAHFDFFEVWSGSASRRNSREKARHFAVQSLTKHVMPAIPKKVDPASHLLRVGNRTHNLPIDEKGYSGVKLSLVWYAPVVLSVALIVLNTLGHSHCRTAVCIV